jgi:putative membrane protein
MTTVSQPPGADARGDAPAAGSLPGQARRLHPVSIVFAALAVGLRDLVFGVVLVLSTGWWWLLLAGPLLALVSSTLRWWRMTWWVDDDRLIVDRGVFERTHRELPVDRVQQIEVIRTFRHQVLGVATLRIEAAGGEPGGEVDLLLSAHEATDIRSGLLARRDHAARGTGPRHPTVDAGGAPNDGEEVLLRLGLGRLALSGLVGPQFLALPVALVWLLSLLDDLPDAVRPDVDADDVHLTGLLATIGVVVLGVVAWVVVAMVAGVLAHHDLTVSRIAGDLRLRRGLLDRREVSVPAERVQMARVVEHPVLALFGLTSLRLDSAGGQSTVDATHLTVPALTRDEADRILALALPEAAARPALVPAPTRAIPRSLLRSTRAVLIPAGVVLAIARPTADWVVGVLVAAGLLGLTHGALAWRGLGAHISEHVVASRRGAVIRTTSYVPTRKAQSARAEATIFQRRRGLTTAHVDVAGQRSPPALTDRDQHDATRLAAVVPGATRTDEQEVRAGTGLGRSPHPVA